MGNHMNPLLFEGERLVRMLSIGGEPWFVATDVCRALDIGNSRMAVDRLDEDEKGVSTIDTLGGPQEVTIISEAGVYRLVFTSRKPIAERFKRWLAHEVIPAIRKTGAYAPGAALDGEVIPPPVDKRAFPDWPTDEMRAKRGVVDMYRMLYGTISAQWISPQLGFPIPPHDMIERGRQLPLFQSPPDH
jgi:hypothetical protein